MKTKKCLNCNNSFEKGKFVSKKNWKKTFYCSPSCFSGHRKGKTLSEIYGDRKASKIKRKMSENNHNKKYGLSDEHKEKIGKANAIANIGKQLGHIVTKETREKISEAQKGIKKPERSREKHPNWKGGYKNTKTLQNKYRAQKYESSGVYTVKEWEELKEKYGNKCLRCGAKEGKAQIVADHVIPLSIKGLNTIDNLQPLCFSCNSKKYTKSTDYRK